MPVENLPTRLIVHGGAGIIRRNGFSAEREQAYRLVLAESLNAGHAVLAAGGSSIDAVISFDLIRIRL